METFWNHFGTILDPFLKHFFNKLKMKSLVYIYPILYIFLIDFSYFSTSKIIDFHGTVVIFEFFVIPTRDVSFVLFLCHFGPPNRPKWYPKSSKMGAKMVPKIDTRKGPHF